MRYASLLYNDVVNSDGVALTIYCQGCPHHCKGCFSQSTWDFEGGLEFTEQEIKNCMYVLANNPYDNIVLLGGEPFCNIELCSAMLNINNMMGKPKTVWCYTGYLFEDLLRDEKKRRLLEKIDVLIDGPFVEKLKDSKLKYRGSSNQRIIDVRASLIKKQIILLDKYMNS